MHPDLHFLAARLQIAFYDRIQASKPNAVREFEQDLRRVAEYGRRDPSQPVPNRRWFRYLDEKRQRRTMSETEVTPLPIVDITPAKPVDTGPASNITGLVGGAFQAKLAEMRVKIADRQKVALARIDGAVVSGASRIEAAADDVAQKVDKEISAALQEFSQFSNGGPA